MKLDTSQVKKFQSIVWDFYSHNKRDLPWRNTQNPYHIWISEIMLQQTQVDRVIPKYNQWILAFPTIQTLSQTPLRDVLVLWKGLGYNRRALHLHKTAQILVSQYGGTIPQERAILKTLPGIGDYISGALCTFALNKPEVFIETNIRTVYIHHFFKNKNNITDKEILKYIQASVDTNNPREWYWALMDYGAHLKKAVGNESRKSKHHTTQSQFKGSNREQRSQILAYITDNMRVTPKQIETYIGTSKHSVKNNVRALETEGFIIKKGRYFMIS